MQIYRKCGKVDTSYWCKAGVVSDTWRSWGFIDATTGDEIQPNPEIASQYSGNEQYENNKGYWDYKWKYDTTEPYNYFMFSNCTTDSGFSSKYFGFNLSSSRFLRGPSPYGGDYYTNGPKCSWESLKQEWNRGCSGISEQNRDTYRNIFFIPLKNNGFLFNLYHSCFTGLTTQAYVNTMYFRQSPCLFSPTTIGYGEGWRTAYHCHCTVIGFYNNVTNEINYITIKFRDYWDYDLAFTFDFKHNNLIESLNQTYIDTDGSYTDVRENICTLIKYPYETGFLSNLFLISTEPETQRNFFQNTLMPDSCGLEGKFFSFNGRNFYGCFYNLAVELPSN